MRLRPRQKTFVERSHAGRGAHRRGQDHHALGGHRRDDRRRREGLRAGPSRRADGADQPRLPRFKAYTNYDNYVAVDTWTKIGINNTDYNDQGAFDAANNHFVAPVDGTYIFGATLLYKINASATARMRGRLVLNGTTEIRGSLGEISATHVSLATAIWLQTMVPLTAGDTVELQGYFRVADGYFAADHTSFWGCKIG